MQGDEISHHILDLLCIENRSTPESGRDTLEPFCAMVGRHDGLGIDATTVNDPRSQLGLRKSASGPREIGSQIALLALFGKGSTVAEQTKTTAAIGHDRPASGRIALQALKWLIDPVAVGCTGT